ncbi:MULTISPECIES: hypothetical protein [unclassified Streptomyces]|uniref:hypothetical protein n=1 Tax=unclassified Streptomyces TaxID=2593676 RepID=UPI0033313F15
MTRGDLADAERELIEPHLPLGVFGPVADLRSYFSALMWRFRTGSPLRDVPERRLLVDGRRPVPEMGA